MKVEDLKGLFMRVSGKSESVAEKMASTFKALAGKADFGASPQPPMTPAPDGEERGERREERNALTLAPLRLHHDVHVHLPISTDIAVYDAIFHALRRLQHGRALGRAPDGQGLRVALLL